ncbi:phosphoadenosine phosphosulfate reductase family protein [bacterium]|nr:phosphoadenosine phosphosulfate reductase family protein [bacterium]
MREHHILSLSGGKDSTALAFFIKNNMPKVFEKIELVFGDTECELPETYDYLNKTEVFLDKPIRRLVPEKSFEYLMQTHGYLPSPIKRWCTVELKTKPFQKYINGLFETGVDVVYLYIGIRADEPRRAKYNKYNDLRIREVYPFVDSGLGKGDVLEILDKTGIGLPKYYEWSNRSGCYFCPFQTKMNWVRLYENHPDLFMKAKAYEDERNSNNNYKKVGWNMDMLLEDMIKPENIAKIKESYYKRKSKKVEKSKKLIHRFTFEYEKENV